MGISAVVALASSPPPRWSAEKLARAPLVFDERNERTAILSIELDGELDADVGGADVKVIATADRTASDLELSVPPFEPSPEGLEQLETTDQAEADFRAGFAAARRRCRTARSRSLAVLAQVMTRVT